jgi:transcriptional regulator with XRE-family HTH domain
MPATASPERRCDRCGARLASYNRTSRCARCSSLRESPVVPREFWDHAQMRDALATWHMGRVIYAYRTHPWHGLPLKQSVVGSWFGLTQTQLSRIENGRAPEELSKLVRWAEVLRIPSELLWFKMPGDGGTEWPSAAAPLVPVIVRGRTILLPVDEQAARDRGLELVLDQLADRRQGNRQPEAWVVPVHALPEPAGIGPALVASDVAELERLAAALDDARKYLDGSVVGLFREQLERSKAEDGRHGPARALPLMLGILGAITDHVREARPEVRRNLLCLGAEAAEFIGWLYRDLKDVGNATYWYDRAMEWAQEACDMPMQGYVLLKKSQMAYDTRDAQRVVSFAEAAHQGPWRYSRTIRVEVAQQHALGLAMTGAPLGEVEKEMASARELLTQSTDDEESGAADQGFTIETLLLRQAACYTEAGKPATAAQMFGEVIGSGTLSKRDTGFFSARRALALALSGEPDEAVDAGLQACKVARETSSERTLLLLGEVVQELRPWSTRPRTRELRQAVLSPQ